MPLSELAAGPGEARCQTRLRTRRCIRGAAHEPGCVFVGSEYGRVDEDGRE